MDYLRIIREKKKREKSGVCGVCGFERFIEQHRTVESL